MKSRMFGIALVGVLLLGGCSPESEPTESPSPSATPRVSPSPLPSPSPSPTVTELLTFPSPPEGEAPEVAEIRAAWERYEVLVDRFYRDPDFNDLNALNDVAVGSELHSVTLEVQGIHEANLRVAGPLVFRSVEISNPEENTEGVLVALVRHCQDPTASKLMDAETGEVLFEATEMVQGEAVMERLPDGFWRVAHYQSEDAAC